MSEVPPGLDIEPEGVTRTLFFGPPPPASYQLGPGDVLEIDVFDFDQFSRTVRVAGDGTIRLPLVGNVDVSELLPEEAAARLAERLQDGFVQDPQVGVFVREYNSRSISFLGAVQEPGTYQLLGRKTLLQVLAEAGGVSDEAGTTLHLFRQAEDGRRARLSIPLRELLVEGDSRWDIWVRAGDVVSVPMQPFVRISVLGAVEKPGIYELPEEEATLLNALASAEGLSLRASKNGIEVQRGKPTETKTTLSFKLDDILSGRVADERLQQGDVVYVKEKFF